MNMNENRLLCWLIFVEILLLLKHREIVSVRKEMVRNYSMNVEATQLNFKCYPSALITAWNHNLYLPGNGDQRSKFFHASWIEFINFNDQYLK